MSARQEIGEGCGCAIALLGFALAISLLFNIDRVLDIVETFLERC